MEDIENVLKIGKAFSFSNSLKNSYKLLLEAYNQQSYLKDDNFVQSLINWQKDRVDNKPLKIWNSTENIENFDVNFVDMNDKEFNDFLINEMTLDPVKLANAMLWVNKASKQGNLVSYDKIQKVNKNISDAIKQGANVFLVKKVYDKAIEKINEKINGLEKNSDEYKSSKTICRDLMEAVENYIPKLDNDGYYNESFIPQINIWGEYTSDGGDFGSAYYSIYNQLKGLNNAIHFVNDGRGLAMTRIQEEENLFLNLIEERECDLDYLNFVFRDNKFSNLLEDMIKKCKNNDIVKE